jgi:hypothetical protein
MPGDEDFDFEPPRLTDLARLRLSLCNLIVIVLSSHPEFAKFVSRMV